MSDNTTTAATPGEAVKTFREYLSVHPDACASMGGHAMDDMALDLARIALNFQAVPRGMTTGLTAMLLHELHDEFCDEFEDGDHPLADRVRTFLKGAPKPEADGYAPLPKGSEAGQYLDSTQVFNANEMRAYVDADRAMRAAAPAAVAVPQGWMEHLGFELDAEADGIWQVIEDTGARREATLTERVLWKELTAIRAALAAAPAADARTERWNPLDGGNPETALQMASVIAHRDAEQSAAAPVVLPEPDAYLCTNGEHRGVSLEYRGPMDLAAGTTQQALYTFNTVRALLATATGLPAQADRQPFLLYLSDRADGVAGHYAIARWNPAGYREVWNLRSHRWSSFSDDVLNLEQAQELLKQVAIPTAPQAQAVARDAEKVKPEAGHYVLAWMEGRKVPIRAMWVPQYYLSAGDEAPEGWGEYSNEKDDWYCPEGWYEANEHEETHWAVAAPVVSWMELPRLSIAAQAAAKEGAKA